MLKNRRESIGKRQFETLPWAHFSLRMVLSGLRVRVQCYLLTVWERERRMWLLFLRVQRREIRYNFKGEWISLNSGTQQIILETAKRNSEGKRRFYNKAFYSY